MTKGLNENWIRIGGILASVSIALLQFRYGLRVNPNLQVLEYFQPVAVLIVIMSLPSFLQSRAYPRHRTIFLTEGVSCIVLILGMTIIGLLFKENIFLSSTLWLTAVFLTGFELSEMVRTVRFRYVAAAWLMIMFVFIIAYSQEYLSFLPGHVQIVLGAEHLDRLFHTSICSMISSVGVATTGIDGIPYVKYHWGSHAIFAGLKSWMGMTAYDFYKIAYAPIALPLLFKWMVSFTNALARRLRLSVSPLSFVVLVCVLYSLGCFGPMVGQPIISESFTISLIFVFSYLVALIGLPQQISRNGLAFYLTTLLVIMIISLCKVSTGLVFAAGLAYLQLRLRFSFVSFVKVVIGTVVLFSFILIVIHPGFSKFASQGLLYRIINTWKLSNGFITYSFGVVLLFSTIFFSEKIYGYKDFLRVFRSKKYIELEALAIMTICGFIAGICASNFAMDTYSFNVVGFVVAIPFAAVLSCGLLKNISVSKNIGAGAAFFVIVLAITSRPDVFQEFTIRNDSAFSAQKLTSDQQLLSNFIESIKHYENKNLDEKLVIYVGDEDSDWFYYRGLHQLHSSLLVPAISGIPLVGGVTENIYESGMKNFGVCSYLEVNSQPVNSVELATARAKRDGFDQLLYFQAVNGQLIQKLIVL